MNKHLLREMLWKIRIKITFIELERTTQKFFIKLYKEKNIIVFEYPKLFDTETVIFNTFEKTNSEITFNIDYREYITTVTKKLIKPIWPTETATILISNHKNKIKIRQTNLYSFRNQINSFVHIN